MQERRNAGTAPQSRPKEADKAKIVALPAHTGATDTGHRTSWEEGMAFKLCRRLLRRRSGLWRRPAAGLLALVFALQPLLAQAEEVARRAVLVVDVNTGRTLYQSGAGALRYPASLTKLMTLFLLFELIEQGRLSLSSKIRFSANAASAPPSRLEVEEGTEITVGDAIKALIVKSANDVAIAVAERIAGSEERFAELMNRKAAELGMKHTEFRNASGLYHPEQVTTARDMIALALSLYDRFPRYYPLFATRTFTWGGDTFRSHNTLLFRYKGLEGLKTGYIRASGFNLVAVARRGKKRVLVAYFGGKTSALRNATVRARLDAGFAKASAIKTRQPAPLTAAKGKRAPPGGQAKDVSVAVISPQPAKRASADGGIEIARVRPVRAGVPEAKASALRPGAGSGDDDAPASTSEPKGVFHVQVGAFHTKSEAERQLASVGARAGSILGEHAAYMSQVKRGDKVFFRARYVGFEAKDAAAGVCSDLKQMKIDCLVMKAE
jgi:D-alanyl-D-alanine carboxypeptidase